MKRRMAVTSRKFRSKCLVQLENVCHITLRKQATAHFEDFFLANIMFKQRTDI